MRICASMGYGAERSNEKLLASMAGWLVFHDLEQIRCISDLFNISLTGNAIFSLNDSIQKYNTKISNQSKSFSYS